MNELATYVHAMGRGPSKGRHLTREEACDAMTQMLAGTAAPEAVGALLMLMRYCGDTADELAGFVDALRADAAQWATLDVDLDWPCYAAGKSRGWPLFLLAAQNIAQTGRKVLLHGWNSHQSQTASIETGCRALGIAVCDDISDAKSALENDSIAYVPLRVISASALDLVQKRDVLGLRSPVNTALRAFNPARAKASVQGVFHPSYRGLQMDTANALGQAQLGVVKGAGGEFEVNPTKATELHLKTAGSEGVTVIPSIINPPERLADISKDLTGLPQAITAQGNIQGVIRATTALALMVLEDGLTFDDAFGQASELMRQKQDM